MTTSGVSTWSLTARDIIKAALQENRIVDLGEEPEADEAEACLVRLNALLKSWQVGRHLESDATIAVMAGNAALTLPADVEDIVTARLVLSATNERLLGRWERDEYLVLPNKIATGTPSVYYPNETAGTMTLWPVPSVNGSVKIDYLRKPQTVTSLSETVDFPERYQEALYAMLAVRCAGLFGEPLSQELVARAERLRREAEDAERPATYTMTGSYY